MTFSRQGSEGSGARDDAQGILGAFVPPSVVRSVNLAGFPEVVAPKVIDRKRGDIKQDSAGDGSWSRLGGLLVGQ